MPVSSKFATLVATLNLNIQNFSKNLRQASDDMSKFTDDLQGNLNDAIVEPAKEAKLQFKDVGRIVQGIVISKIFYTSLNLIRKNTASIVEFIQELEHARLVFANLFHDVQLADEFINVLKDFAATSPFSFIEAEQASKRLLAYGIQYKNVMFMMQGIMAAATVQGNPMVIESISRALGQIYTKGRLMNEEMRQLAEAGIPVYEILSEKLGLTVDQLRNLGDEAISSNVAINALIEGMIERFGSTLEASNRTWGGMLANIYDNFLMIAADVFAPIADRIKATAWRLNELLQVLRDISATKGLGGVFEYLIPPELQDRVRQFLANILNLWSAIKMPVGEVFKQFLVAVIDVLNILLPVLNLAISTFKALVEPILQNEKVLRVLLAVLSAGATAWLIFTLNAKRALIMRSLIGIINNLSKSIAILSGLLVSNPLVLFFGILSAGLVGLALSSNKVNKSIGDFFKNITSLTGVDPDSILIPSQEEKLDDISKFNQKLDETGAALDETGKKAKKAGEAGKDLLSFDEVYKLLDKSAGDQAALPDMSDTDVQFPAISGEDFIPEIPDFTSFTDGFVGTLVEDIAEQIKKYGPAALLGGLIGALLGGPIGAKIGMVVGPFARWLWDKIGEAIGMTEQETTASFIGMGLGAAIGAIVAGPLGALVGGSIGILVGWVIGQIIDGFRTGEWDYTTLSDRIGTLIGGAIGFFIGGPPGLIVGALIGKLVGWIAGQFIEGFTTGEWDITALSNNIGTLLGGVIGLIAGGPAGMAIGGAIGRLVGWIVGKITEGFQTGEWDVEGLSGAIGTGLGAAIGLVVGGPAGAAIGALAGYLIGKFFGMLIEKFGPDFVQFMGFVVEKLGELAGVIIEFFKGVIQAIVTLWNTVVTTIVNLCVGLWEKLQEIWLAIKQTVVDVFTAIVEFVITAWDSIVTTIITFCSNLLEAITLILENIKAIIITVFENVAEFLSMIWDEIVETVVGFCVGMWENLTEVWGALVTSIIDLCTWLAEKVPELWSVIVEAVIGFCSDVKETAISIWDSLVNTIITFCNNLLSSISGFFSDIYTTITDSVSNAYNSVQTFFSDMVTIVISEVQQIYDSVVTYFGNTYTTIRDKISSMYTSVRDGISSIYTVFIDWISNLKQRVFDKLFGWLDSGISKLKEFFGLETKAQQPRSYPAYSYYDSGYSKYGHATGGIFTREHMAKFAEGNKAEMAVPLENASAMRPFVDAITEGILSGMMPAIAMVTAKPQAQDAANLRPLYVGTLVADERGLKELYRKMQVIDNQEIERRGF